VRLGVGVPVSGSWATPANIRRMATLSEDLGYDSLWTFQRLLHPVDEEWGSAYHGVLDPIAALAYVAAMTSRIRVGLAVVNMPYYAPLVLSKALTTLDVVSEGRLEVGLGLGWAPPEFEAVGVSRAGRGARAEEYVRYLKTTWTEAEPEFHGAYYDLPRSLVEPKPVQKPYPPVLMGGAAEVALRRVGRIADGWISSSRANLTTIGQSIEVVRAAAVEAGRDPGPLRFVVRGVVKLTDDDLPDRRPLHGSATQIRADLDALADIGVTEVFFDLNWDSETTAAETDSIDALHNAERLLRAFAPQ